MVTMARWSDVRLCVCASACSLASRQMTLEPPAFLLAASVPSDFITFDLSSHDNIHRPVIILLTIITISPTLASLRATSLP